MKIMILLLIVLMIPSLVLGGVVINEVYYDPVNTETGGEAVELYNTDNVSIDLSGYVIKTKNSVQDAVIPNGESIGAKGYYLIADAGFSMNKDNSTWPNADYEEAITLTNSDAGVALVYNNTTIDAFGWGNAPAGLYLSNPSSPTVEGKSLQRQNFTNNNSFDFFAGFPSFRNSNYSNSNTISMKITVHDYHSKILNVTILDEDSVTNGTQIIPAPGSVKDINVNVSVDNATSVSVLLNGNYFNLIGNESYFVGNAELNFYDSEGSYNLTVIVLNNHNVTIKNNYSIDYLSLKAVFVDVEQFSCDIPQGSYCEIKGDYNLSTMDNATVKNIGNVPINVSLTSTSFISQSSEFPINRVMYSFNNSDYGVNKSKVLMPNLLLPLSFKISADENQEEGDYLGDLMVLAK